MSSDLSVPRVGPPTAAAETARSRPQAPTTPERPAPTATSFPNPTLRLDPGLALVVIEFRDDSGKVRNTIPTQQQLDAYRSWERSQVGLPPRGKEDPAPVAPTAGGGDPAPAVPPPFTPAPTSAAEARTLAQTGQVIPSAGLKGSETSGD